MRALLILVLSTVVQWRAHFLLGRWVMSDTVALSRWRYYRFNSMLGACSRGICTCWLLENVLWARDRPLWLAGFISVRLLVLRVTTQQIKCFPFLNLGCCRRCRWLLVWCVRLLSVVSPRQWWLSRSRTCLWVQRHRRLFKWCWGPGTVLLIPKQSRMLQQLIVLDL